MSGPVFWEPDSQTFYLYRGGELVSAPLSSLSIGPLTRAETMPDTAVRFAPERRMPQYVCVHAVLAAVHRAEAVR